MFFFTWLSAIHRHGENRPRGWYTFSYLLPMLCVLVYLLEYVLVAFASEEILPALAYLSEGRLYAGNLFDIWQMWSYVFYHDGLLHLFINMLFFIPVSIYWERHCGWWYLPCLLLLLPFSVVVSLQSPFPLIDLGLSPMVYAMYGALLLQRRHRHGEYIVVQWWGTRLSLKRVVKPLRWALFAYLVLDLVRISWVADLAWPAFGMYLGSQVIAACAGASLFTVFDHVRRLVLAEQQETTT